MPKGKKGSSEIKGGSPLHIPMVGGRGEKCKREGTGFDFKVISKPAFKRGAHDINPNVTSLFR